MRRAQRRPRAGFTLLEVLVAFVVLAGALLTFTAFTERFVRATSRGALASTASDLATERLEAAKGAATYAGVDAFAGAEASIASFPNFRRVTVVRRTQSATRDDRTVTVTVTHPALRDTVAKTVVIHAF